MADFLSAAWFEALNETLKAAGPPPLEDLTSPFRIVLDFADGPTSSPHALTFTLSGATASAEPGDHLAANVVLRLSYIDAELLTSGTLESGGALREGRMKIRGDVHALLPLLTWMMNAHSS